LGRWIVLRQNLAVATCRADQQRHRDVAPTAVPPSSSFFGVILVGVDAKKDVPPINQ
jgi:hypothetical protein